MPRVTQQTVSARKRKEEGKYRNQWKQYKVAAGGIM
jgi:hypothetical protein